MSSTKRPRSPESGPGTSKKKRTTRRVAVPDHSKKVRASTLHVSSSGRIGRKKLKVEKEVLAQAVSNNPTDTQLFLTPSAPPGHSPTDPPEALSTECEQEFNILDSQEIPSNAEKKSADSEKKKSKRSNTNSVNFLLSFSLDLFLTFFLQTKLLEWLQHRETFLLEIIRGYGLGDYSGIADCATCHSRAGKFRCLDCFPHCPLRCVGCLVENHRENPLHRIEVCFSESVLLLPNCYIFRSGMAHFMRSVD
jgi:hypothetical protein